MDPQVLSRWVATRRDSDAAANGAKEATDPNGLSSMGRFKEASSLAARRDEAAKAQRLLQLTLAKGCIPA